MGGTDSRLGAAKGAGLEVGHRESGGRESASGGAGADGLTRGHRGDRVQGDCEAPSARILKANADNTHYLLLSIALIVAGTAMIFGGADLVLGKL